MHENNGDSRKGRQGRQIYPEIPHFPGQTPQQSSVAEDTERLLQHPDPADAATSSPPCHRAPGGTGARSGGGRGAALAPLRVPDTFPTLENGDDLQRAWGTLGSKESFGRVGVGLWVCGGSRWDVLALSPP